MAAGKYIMNSCEEFLASEVKLLEQQFEAAYETFQQEHEHETPVRRDDLRELS